MATIIGNLKSLLTLDISGWAKGFARARKDVDQFERRAFRLNRTVSNLAGAFGIAFGGSSVIRGIRSRIGAMDELNDSARKLGIEAKSLAGIRFAGEQVGVEAGMIQKALQRLPKAASEAAMGGKEAGDAFRELGIDARAFLRLPVDKQLRRIAESFARVQLHGDRVRLTTKIFGREGANLVNILSLGSRGIDNFQRQAEALGIAIDTKLASNADRANDAIGRLQNSIRGAGNEIAGAMAPAIEKIADSLTMPLAKLQLKLLTFLRDNFWMTQLLGGKTLAVNPNIPGWADPAGNISKAFGGLTLEGIEANMMELERRISANENAFKAPSVPTPPKPDSAGERAHKLRTRNRLPYRDRFLNNPAQPEPAPPQRSPEEERRDFWNMVRTPGKPGQDRQIDKLNETQLKALEQLQNLNRALERQRQREQQDGVVID